MPKLRRRRIIEQDNGTNRRLLEADACTSGSATSVDLRDLPFDMPKLRRRLRPPTLSESQASSSQSVAEQSGGNYSRSAEYQAPLALKEKLKVHCKTKDGSKG